MSDNPHTFPRHPWLAVWKPSLGRTMTVAFTLFGLIIGYIAIAFSVMIVTSGSVFAIRNMVLRDRKHLSQEGLIIVAMAFDRTHDILISGPDIISRGFVFVRENEDIIEDSREVVRSIIDSYEHISSSDWPVIKNRIKDELRRFLNDKIKRNPMILPVIVDLG